MMVESGILDGKDEIMEYLKCSEHKLLKYHRMGMPVLNDGGRWLAHRDNLEVWFRGVTWPNKEQGRKIHKTVVR
jgi:hypothetical protein